jgi:mannosyl-oligosaccharide glucosidase
MHVDLQAWMIFFARSLQKVADHLGLKDDAKMYQDHAQKLTEVLEKVHWDDNSKSFTDVTFTEAGELRRVVHKGYLSILPLALEILPRESEKVKWILDLIQNAKELWSPYGLCSLSKSDQYFGEGENYWRGPIWMNINYLVLQALHRNYMQPGPHQAQAAKIYADLRKNLIANVFKQYQSTGFIWEQYSCTDGQGSRSHPFTGWTSLLLLVMAEKY